MLDLAPLAASVPPSSSFSLIAKVTRMHVVPQSSTLKAGESVQMSVEYSADAAGVVWRVDGPGKISNTGIYTTPSWLARLFNRRTTATVYATSVSAPKLVKTCVVTLLKK